MPPRTRKAAPAAVSAEEPTLDQMPSVTVGSDQAAADATAAAPHVIGDVCPLCWPAGPPAGATSGGCEHDCAWHLTAEA